MTEREIVLLESILNDARNSAKITNLLALIPELPKQSLKKIIKIIIYELFSSNKSQTQLQCIRVLKYLMMLQNPFIVSKVNRNLAPKLLTLFSFSPDPSKFNLWIDSRLSRQKSLFKFLILTLKCVEYWAETQKMNSDGEYSQLYTAYHEIKDRGIEFPPSFFLQPYEAINKKYLKKDLRKVNRFSEEFESLISIRSVNKVKVLKKILSSYEKTLDVHEEFIKKQDTDPDVYFKDTRSRVKANIFKFLLWKSSNFTELFDPIAKISILVLDPSPKSEPQNEVQRESLMVSSQSSSKSSLSQLEDIPDDFDHKQGLSSMYKQDLSMLQDNYLRVFEEKETLNQKISALETQAKDLKQLIVDQKKIIEEFREENYRVMNQNTNLNELNTFLTVKTEELNIVLDKLEKSKIYELRVLENLENNNELLLLSNQNLKQEIMELKKNKESLLGQIQLMESVTERDECVENSETVKNMPNDSVGSALGKRKVNSNERKLMNISSFDIIIDDEGYDNEELHFEYLQKGSGIIFDDEKIWISAEFEIKGKKSEGHLKIHNKTDKKLKILLEICSFPKEFSEFTIPTGSFRLKSSEEISLSVKIVASKLFLDSPLIKITYETLYQTKFIKLPVSPLMYFKKTGEILDEKFLLRSEKRMKLNCEEWKILKKKFFLYGNRVRVVKGESHKLRAGLLSVFGKCCLELVRNESELIIVALGSNQLMVNVVVKNAYMLICNCLFKV